jgi:hypothetical protein
MKKLLSLGLLSAVMIGAAGLAQAAAPKPVTVFEDPSGDADFRRGVGQSIPAGVDLVSGSIAQDGKELEFVVTHADMPPTGSAGEAFRLVWGLTVGTTQYEMTVKSFDVGKPDVVASAMGQDPNGEERVGQVYQGVARFEECGTISLGINWSQCTALGYYEATFDPATKTATWRIPLSIMKAKKGTTIAGGAGGRATTGCQICWVAHYAERSLTSAGDPHTIADSATQTVSFKVK